ncbi:MAG: chromosomal replication initiator protein DnaA [Desulfovibrio sp.]|uniref:DnaA ATPase domain-containing protein n=1 Tax=Desulfovibrio sp. TaxID=885 RepID=UPI00135DBDA6|nr:DnaA/Hda family protein [Desulfovibrio sp.]MTJ93695.1 chromosomal replication initiator protein DnaA [Desulfovibrio sp.]
MREQWSEISENLKKMLHSGVFKVWIAPLQAQVHAGGLLLTAPNAFVASWLEGKMLATLREAAAPVLGLEPAAVDVRITAATDAHAPVASAQAANARPVANGQTSGIVPAACVQQTAPIQLSAAANSAAISSHDDTDSFAHTSAVLGSAFSGLAAGAAPAYQETPLPAARPQLQATLPISSAPAYRLATNWRYSFADFVVGPTNNMAVAAAQDVSRSSGCVRTLFMNSAPGLGKTHLAQAVGRAIAEERSGARVGYLTAEDFASRFVAALRTHDIENFKSRFRDLDVLLLEDVHFLQGKEKMQDMALAVVKNLQAKGGRVIFTSSFSPRDLQKVDSQLVSHFCSGILTDIGRPNEDMRRHILERKAKTFQVLLPDSVCELLASRLDGDVRQMESCLNSLIFKARLLNCGLNLDLAMEVLSQYAEISCGPDLPTIVRLVCESYGLNERQLNSRSRRKECVIGRNTVYYLARKHTELTLEEIGGKFNRRHSTVIKGITSVERELSRETTLGRQIARAMKLIERNAGMGA